MPDVHTRAEPSDAELLVVTLHHGLGTTECLSDGDVGSAHRFSIDGRKPSGTIASSQALTLLCVSRTNHQEQSHFGADAGFKEGVCLL